MVDAPDNVIFEYLRRLDTKLNHVIDGIGDMKIRMTASKNESLKLNCRLRGVNRRIDRVEARLERSSGVSNSSNCRIEVTT